MTEHRLTGFTTHNQPIFERIDHRERQLSQSILYRCDCRAITQVLFTLPYRCPDCGEWVF